VAAARIRRFADIASGNMQNQSRRFRSGLSGAALCLVVASVTLGGCAGGSTTRSLSRLDNSLLEWSPKPSPNPGGDGGSALDGIWCQDSDFCVAAGEYQAVGAAGTRTLIEKWDGRTWSVVKSPSPDGPRGDGLNSISCTSLTFCVAVGYSGFDEDITSHKVLVEQWDGSTWALVPSGLLSSEKIGPSQLTSVSCTNRTFCVAVGTSYPFDGMAVALTMEWNGRTWRVVEVPGAENEYLSDVSCTSSNFCMAVGGGSTSGELAIEMRKGSWSVTQTRHVGAVGDVLSSVSCTRSSTCVAVGDYSLNPSVNASLPVIEMWDGHRWEVPHKIPKPPETGYGNLSGVSCSSSFHCTGVGAFEFPGNPGGPLTYTLAGNNWTPNEDLPLPRGSAGPFGLNSVACTSATTCTAVGTAGSPSNSQTLIESSMAR